MERTGITITGLVQGVGFRAFVCKLASRLGLHGFVKNHSGSLLIEVQGDRAPLSQFLEELYTQRPSLSRIDRIVCRPIAIVAERGFRIEPSEKIASASVFVSPDIATCDECLAELFDPRNRRYRYPFINCTHCGPRYTIIRRMPYDRERTTMAAFKMCKKCRSEYEDHQDRRFHAQPIACPDCGPRLELQTLKGESISSFNLIVDFADAILDGKIGVMKGLGGFDLVCDATNPSAVAALRQRKERAEKPFAVMVSDAIEAEKHCLISPREHEMLVSSMRTIVLLKRRNSGSDERPLIPSEVAPASATLGLMLPYTPLHHLLLNAVGGGPLVITSGNQSDEPIACQDQECRTQLDGIADLMLTHDHPIHIRCDDSVVRVVQEVELPIRRSRGYVPLALPLPVRCPCPMVAVGGEFEGVFAVGQGDDAILSHHLGDMSRLSAVRAFDRELRLYGQLFELSPQLIVHDLHPDYLSTKIAHRIAEKQQIPTLAVQHHHAHLASCLAENGLDQPVIGITFDGTGYGTDHAVWGGEFLVGDSRQALRAGHLRYVPLPGADAAIREPWRMGVSYLQDADVANFPVPGVEGRRRAIVEKLIDRGLNSPPTSSMERFFDAVAAITGICGQASFEGQAAIRLEEAASEVNVSTEYPFQLVATGQSATLIKPDGEQVSVPPLSVADQIRPFTIDTRPTIRAIVADLLRNTSVSTIARRFHSTVSGIIVAACRRIRLESGLDSVALSGGVFLNALLTSEVLQRLSADGFRVYRHLQVPPNDGGLSLGQLAVAAACYTQQKKHDEDEQNSDFFNSPIGANI